MVRIHSVGNATHCSVPDILSRGLCVATGGGCALSRALAKRKCNVDRNVSPFGTHGVFDYIMGL